MRVHNQARDFVRFVGDDVLGEEVGEGQISQGKLGRHALLGRFSRNTGQHVSAAQRCRFREQFAQAVERVTDVADGVGKRHRLGRCHFRIAVSLARSTAGLC
jgi:hypothetical protein